MVIGARGVAWVLAIGAVALGATTRPGPRHAPRVHGGDLILAADFHVHSFPGDGGLPPWDIATEAERRGLDVVALTNHNSMASWNLARMLRLRASGVLLLPGVELTSAGYHMAAVGVHTPIAWRQSPASAAVAVHAQGGVAIAAHPGMPSPSRFDDAALAALDGFEAASSGDALEEVAALTRHAMAQRPSLSPIGSSDFHYIAPIGVCRTFVFVTERSPAAVLDAIRRGRTVACDGQGETYGAAELAAAVAGECRQAASSAPAGSGLIDTVATGGAWLAMAALVALGAREPGLE